VLHVLEGGNVKERRFGFGNQTPLPEIIDPALKSVTYAA
jgi:hypothetical protein